MARNQLLGVLSTESIQRILQRIRYMQLQVRINDKIINKDERIKRSLYGWRRKIHREKKSLRDHNVSVEYALKIEKQWGAQ